MDQFFSESTRRSFVVSGLTTLGIGISSFVHAFDSSEVNLIKRSDASRSKDLSIDKGLHGNSSLHDQRAAANEALRLAFVRHPLLKRTHIEGYIDDRTAALFGTVRSLKQKRIAEELAQEVVGASYVKNNLRVDKDYH